MNLERQYDSSNMNLTLLLNDLSSDLLHFGCAYRGLKEAEVRRERDLEVQ